MKCFFKILIIILTGSNSMLYAQSFLQKMKFASITPKNGLSQNIINCTLQDKHGVLWFGTANGLSRYDGYSFKTYKTKLDNANSLSNNYVLCLYEDKAGYLWVGTFGGGLNRFTPSTEEFVRYQHHKGDVTSIASNDVRSILEDTEGNIWVGLYNGGVSYLDFRTHKFKTIPYEPRLHKATPHHALHLVKARDNGFWVGTTYGLFYLDKSKEQFTRHFYPASDKKLAGFHNGVATMDYDHNNPSILWLSSYDAGLVRFNTQTLQVEERLTHDPANKNSISSNTVWEFHQDKNGIYWIGTKKGLNRFDPKTKKITRFFHNPLEPKSITGNNIQDIYEDNAGSVWLATYDGGISSFNPYLDNFAHYSKFEQPTKNTVTSFCEDQQGNLWFGLSKGAFGLVKFQLKTQTIEVFKHDKYDDKSIAGNVVNTLLTDVDGSIWIGTIGKGLDHYNPQTGKFTHYAYKRLDTNALRSPHIGALHQDKHKPDILWVGSRGGGLFRLDKATKKFKRFAVIKSKNSISHNTVISILTDHKGNLWIATRNGLNLFDPRTGIFTNYLHSPKDLQSISSNYVTSLRLDKNKMLWIGTRNGLNQLDLNKVYKKKVRFKHYGIQDGLPNNIIRAIIEDKHGYLWISTAKGISRFNPLKGKFQNYDEMDGLQGNDFFTNSGLLASNGAVLMGGSNGFNMFYPEKININHYHSNILITDIQVFNKSIIPQRGGILSRPVWATDTIELSPEDKVISFEFAALNYILSNKNTYKIKLENFDHKWRYIGNKHFETYTNLSPGTYTFRVQAANNSGIWSDKEARLVIIVHSPYWATWWFRTTVALFVLTLMITAYRFRISLIKSQKRLLETQVKERTVDLLETNEELQQTNEELQTTLTQVKEKNLIIQEFNEDIRQSINYAQLIQQDMLPSLKLINYYLPESFIFYQPRDIVSGDFYWFAAINDKGEVLSEKQSKNNLEEDYGIFSVDNANKLIIAISDCTGHGVPGAFMSIKGAVLLNQIVNFQGIVCPANILRELDNNIRYSLNQDNTHNRDGMDISILMIDFATQTLEFAGAKSNLIYIKDGNLKEIKGNILPIGGYHEEYSRDFKKITLALEPDTNYYMSSDGYKDQFGGESGKKFLKSRYKSMLLEMHKLPMNQQYQIVQETFHNWKQDYDQVDDILVMGINI